MRPSDALDPKALDHFAEEYYLSSAIDDIDIEELAQRHSIPHILNAIEGCPRVLEMGFGTGLIAAELLRASAPIEVLEGSALLCNEARRRHPGLIVHHAMFESFVPSSPYSAVLALHVLEHVDDPVSLARHIWTWLEAGAPIVAVTPNARSLHRMLGLRMGLQGKLDDLSARDVLVGHQRVYTIPKLSADLEAAGFTVESHFGYLVKPLANSQLLALDSAVLEGLNRMANDVPADLCANIGVVARKRL